VRNQQTKGPVFIDGREYLDSFKAKLVKSVATGKHKDVASAARAFDVTYPTAQRWVDRSKMASATKSTKRPKAVVKARATTTKRKKAV